MIIFHAAGTATPIVLVSVLNPLCSSLYGACGLVCCEISNRYCLYVTGYRIDTRVLGVARNFLAK